MGGRGASSSGVSVAATQATAIENMNESQLDREIEKTQNEISKLKQQREKMTQSATEKALQEAFPLGTGGLSRVEAQKKAGELAEKALSRSKKLSDTIDRQEAAEKRLDRLQKAQKKVKGTGKTSKQIDDERKKESTAKSTRKWTTTQKQQYDGGSLKPRIMKSGDYEIVGKSVLRIFKSGKQIGQAGSLADAKSFVEKYDKAH